MPSIFAPRTETVTTKDGVVAIVLRPRQKNKTVFDEFYIDREIVDTVQPVKGGSDEDFIIVQKVKETKRSIKEVIESQSKEVGLQNLLTKFALNGQDPNLGVKVTDQVLDLTIMPQDSADYFAYIHNIYEAYQNIPVELRKDMSIEEFVKNVKDKDVDAYIASLTKKEDAE